VRCWRSSPTTPHFLRSGAIRWTQRAGFRRRTQAVSKAAARRPG